MYNYASGKYICNLKIAFLWCLFCIPVWISCSSNQQEQIQKIDVPELKEYYVPLMKEAQKWSPDAYLIAVDIPIGPVGKKPWLLWADFNSVTKKKESFSATLDLQGKISGQLFGTELEILQKEPILLSEWEVDSQEALDILVSKNAEAINAIRNLCGSIMLNRASPIAGKSLFWDFQPRECGSPDGTNYYLNAITGEVISP
jgi:hypothetical protein